MQAERNAEVKILSYGELEDWLKGPALHSTRALAVHETGRVISPPKIKTIHIVTRINSKYYELKPEVKK